MCKKKYSGDEKQEFIVDNMWANKIQKSSKQTPALVLLTTSILLSVLSKLLKPG